MDSLNRFGPELILLAMVAVIFAVGVYPAVVLDLLETGVAPIAERLA